VRSLRALAMLPPLAITERLGQQGLQLQKLARGEGMRDLAPVSERFHFEETMVMEEPVELLEPLALILGRLLEQLCARLGTRALSTNELRLELLLESHPDVELRGVQMPGTETRLHQRALRLPVPMLDSKIFLKLLQLDLNSNPPDAP